MQAPQKPFIVEIIQPPTQETTVADVLIGSFGVAGTLAVLAVVLGALLSVGLILWNRRHPPEARHLPPISPLVPGGPLPDVGSSPPSSRVP